MVLFSYVHFSTQSIIYTATATTVSFSPSVFGLLKKLSYMLFSIDIATANYSLVNKKILSKYFKDKISMIRR